MQATTKPRRNRRHPRKELADGTDQESAPRAEHYFDMPTEDNEGCEPLMLEDLRGGPQGGPLPLTAIFPR